MGPFGDFNDPDGFLDGARRAAALGYEGKWAIHPSQIELANRGLLAAARGGRPGPSDHRRTGRGRRRRSAGAAQLDGRMIDAASARMAENVVAQAATIQDK